jgi:hypothetical protein
MKQKYIIGPFFYTKISRLFCSLWMYSSLTNPLDSVMLEYV